MPASTHGSIHCVIATSDYDASISTATAVVHIIRIPQYISAADLLCQAVSNQQASSTRHYAKQAFHLPFE